MGGEGGLTKLLVVAVGEGGQGQAALPQLHQLPQLGHQVARHPPLGGRRQLLQLLLVEAPHHLAGPHIVAPLSLPLVGHHTRHVLGPGVGPAHQQQVPRHPPHLHHLGDGHQVVVHGGEAEGLNGHLPAHRLPVLPLEGLQQEPVLVVQQHRPHAVADLLLELGLVLLDVLFPGPRAGELLATILLVTDEAPPQLLLVLGQVRLELLVVLEVAAAALQPAGPPRRGEAQPALLAPVEDARLPVQVGRVLPGLRLPAAEAQHHWPGLGHTLKGGELSYKFTTLQL